jgi:hypothetical protein
MIHYSHSTSSAIKAHQEVLSLPGDNRRNFKRRVTSTVVPGPGGFHPGAMIEK